MAELKNLSTVNLYCNNLTTDTIETGCMIPLGSVIAIDFARVPVVPTNRFVLMNGGNFPAGTYGALGGTPTPNLSNSRFLCGGANFGAGGSNTHSLTVAQMRQHSHSRVGNCPVVGNYTSGNPTAHTHILNLFAEFGVNTSPASGDTHKRYLTTPLGGAHSHAGLPNPHSHSVASTAVGITGNATAFNIEPYYYNVKFYIRWI